MQKHNTLVDLEPDYSKMSDPEMLEALADDANKWAAAFVQFNPGADHGVMLTWFANAIETAHEHRQRRARLADVRYRGKLLRELTDAELEQARVVAGNEWRWRPRMGDDADKTGKQLEQAIDAEIEWSRPKS